MRTASLAFDMVGGRVLKVGGAVAAFALRPIARLAQPLIRSSAGAMGRSAMSAIKNQMIAPAVNAARRSAAAVQDQAANLLSKARKAMPSFGQNPGCSLANGLEELADASRVGRWMGKAEHEAMVASGMVQESFLKGVTSVASPSNPLTYKASGAGSRYIEFNVRTSALKHADGLTAKIYGPTSIFAKFFNITSMPSATNIVHVPSKLP